MDEMTGHDGLIALSQAARRARATAWFSRAMLASAPCPMTPMITCTWNRRASQNVCQRGQPEPQPDRAMLTAHRPRLRRWAVGAGRDRSSRLVTGIAP